MHSTRRRRSKIKRIWRLFWILVLVGLIAGVVFVVMRTNFGPVAQIKQNPEAKKIPQTTQISSNVLVFGEYILGEVY